MRLPNNNKQIIKKLNLRQLKARKSRNLFAVVAIALTTILFTVIFTLGFGSIESVQQQTIRQSGGMAHASFKEISEEQYDKIKNHPLIKEIGYSVFLGYANNEELLKRHTEIRYMTDNSAKWFFSYPSIGKMPSSKNEIAMDDILLDLMGLPHELGQTITLTYKLGEKEYTDDFILSGYWVGDKVSYASQALVSKIFVEERLEGYQSADIGDLSGKMFADVLFYNTLNIENDTEKVVIDSGYELNQIKHNVNWGYVVTNVSDSNFIVPALCAGLLVLVVGYLIIYNIFQISVLNDIRYYGLLKTIGTTSKQIKALVRRQALTLSVIGIFIGLILGYVIGLMLMPSLLNNMAADQSYVTMNPLIFVLGALFSLVTVMISCRKPIKIAASVSPIEAIKYSEIKIKSKKGIRKSKGGMKLYKMAYANLYRNTKKTVVVILSMFLSLALLNGVFAISNGFNEDKFLSTFSVTDFVVGNVKYFRDMVKDENDYPSQQMIDQIQNMEGVKESGYTYHTHKMHKLSDEGHYKFSSIYTKETLDKQNGLKREILQTIKDKDEDIPLSIYGLDQLPMKTLAVLEGEIDYDNFLEGNSIIISPALSYDDKSIKDTRSYYDIGDEVTIDYGNGNIKKYTVMAKAELSNQLGTRYSSVGAIDVYLPTEELLKHVPESEVLNYSYNMEEEKKEEMQSFLEQYTKSVEPNMEFESKKFFKDQFQDMINMFSIIGGVLCAIVAIVAIINFTNSTLTGIMVRRQELAMLQSIGMTNKQLYKMLMFEGLYYAIFTIIMGLILGKLFCDVVISSILSRIWFFEYSSSVLPIIMAAPILILISVVIPMVLYKGTNKKSVVERLRESE